MAEEDLDYYYTPKIELPEGFLRFGFEKLPSTQEIYTAYSQHQSTLQIRAEILADTTHQLERVERLQQGDDNYLKILRQPQGEAIWAQDTNNHQMMLGLEGIEGADAFPSEENLENLRAKLAQKVGERTSLFLAEAELTLTLGAYLNSPVMEAIRNTSNPEAFWRSQGGVYLSPPIHLQYADGLDLREATRSIVKSGIEEMGKPLFMQEIGMIRRKIEKAASHQKALMIDDFPTAETVMKMRRDASYMADKPIEMARLMMQANTVEELAASPLISEIKKSVADPQAFWNAHKEDLIDTISVAKREEAHLRMGGSRSAHRMEGERVIREITQAFETHGQRKDSDFFIEALPGSEIPERAAIAAIKGETYNTRALCTLAKAPVAELYAVATLMGDQPILTQAYVYSLYTNLSMNAEGRVVKRKFDEHDARNDLAPVDEKEAADFLRFRKTVAGYNDALAARKGNEAKVDLLLTAESPTPTSWQERIQPQQQPTGKQSPLNSAKQLPGHSRNNGRF